VKQKPEKARVTFVRPMGNDGIETDIQTNRPAPESLDRQRNKLRSDLERVIDEGLAFNLQLADPATQANAILKAVLMALESRVEELCAPDPGYQVLTGVLASVGASVRIGPEMARKKLEQFFGKDFQITPGPARNRIPGAGKKK